MIRKTVNLLFVVATALLIFWALGCAFALWPLAALNQSIAAQRDGRTELQQALPKLERPTQYTSSNRCQSCHPRQHASWHQTFHRTMTQVALPKNVVGDFNDQTVTVNGLEYRLFRRGDQFWAEMPDPDQMMYTIQGGKRVDAMTYLVKRHKDSPVERLNLRDIDRVERRVVMATGSHHYQTYWVPGDKKFGRLLQTLPVIYLIRDQRWIPREAAFMHPPESTHMITQWNHHCIRCHSTGGVPGIDQKTGKFATEVGELGIACEACHGPGEQHIRVNHNPLRRYRLHLSGDRDSTIVNPANLDHRSSSEVCGQCHGVYITRQEYAMKYAVQGTLYRPGDSLHETRYYIQHPLAEPTPERQRDFERNPSFYAQRWWPDGTVLAGGREYTAMSVSGCYTRGQISCLSCHSMHESPPADQLSPEMDSARACTQCHDQPQYTTRVSDHTFHSADSSGSNCLNCHMPHTTYALLGAIRSHQIAVPNVGASIRHGVPNACNLCHLDQTVAWAQDHMADWYGIDKTTVPAQQRRVAASLLWLLKGDAAQRVIAAWHYGWQPAQEASRSDWLAPFQARLLSDPYGVVRYVAADGLRTMPGFEDFDFDFLAPQDELELKVEQAILSWQKQASGIPDNSGHILIDDDGTIREREVQTLLRQRNDRPVTIKE